MEIFILLILIVLNGVFAMSEIAIVSARRVLLEKLSKAGDRGARRAIALRDEPNTFLSTVQVGITLIGVTMGAFGEAAIADDIAVYFAQYNWLAPYSQGIAIAIVIVGITYLSLIIGELVPKRLALHHPERIARRIAIPMHLLSRAAHPAVRVLSGSTEFVLRLLRIRASNEPPVTEEEIKSMIDIGTRAGVFAKAEQDLLKNVIRLADRTMGMLMRPRVDIAWLDLEDPIEENKRKIVSQPHSRFPVVRGGEENVLGIVKAKDLLAHVFAGLPIDIAAAMTPPLHVPETMSPLRLLEVFKSSPHDMALVVDEYGDIKGLVTLNDLLEAIVGDLPSLAGEAAEPKIVRRDDGSWLLDGMLSAEELKEVLNVERLPDEEDGSYETLGGFFMMKLGRVPTIADHFEWNGFRFEVVDMDGNRIDRVLVVPPAPDTGETERGDADDDRA